jgi:hypothetical protein
MSSYGINIPSPDEINYHWAAQQQRVEAALKRLDPGDILAIVDSRIAAEPDPTKHPLYQMVLFFLDRQVAVDGATLYDDWRRLIVAAIDTCLDELLAREG